MPQLFHTDFCLSGQCAARQYMEAVLIARVLSDPDERHEAERHAEDILRQGARLLDEQETMRVKQ